LRKGATIPLVALALPTILGMAMLVIDLGNMRLVRGQLQSAADAAALACIQAFDMDTDAASYVAENFAGLNNAAGKPVKLNRDKDILFGVFDEVNKVLVPVALDQRENCDAVQVTVHSTGTPFYFAPMIGLTNFNMTATATARFRCAGGGNFVGTKKVELKNDAYTDSYNSALGNYSAGKATSEGGVSSNKEVKLSDSSIVKGNAYLGPGASIDGAPTGKIVELDAPMSYPEVNYSEAAAANNNASIPNTTNGKKPYDGKKLEVKTNDTLNLPPGVYLFEEVKLEDNATVIISDRTRIFVTKKVDAENGNLQNQTKIPTNLQVYSMQADPLDEIKLPKNFNTYALIYCPSAKVTKKGSSHFFGGIIAEELKSEGGGLHADRSLLKAEHGADAVAILVD
jgi:Flp pilus assembly protein TadG